MNKIIIPTLLIFTASLYQPAVAARFAERYCDDPGFHCVKVKKGHMVSGTEIIRYGDTHPRA